MNRDEKAVLPQLRFLQFKDSPAWNINSFGKLIIPVKDRAGTKKYTLMSVTSGVGLIPQIEKFGREIAGNAYSSYYVIKKNDFAYNKSATKQFPEGYISMLTEYEEAALPNSIFTCFRIADEECVPKFFDHLFHNNYHGSWLRKYIEVGARAHGSLSVDTKHLWDMPIALPRTEEQQKIADCLSSLDDLITEEGKKLDALKAHKKGLMQKLFPAEGETVPEWRFPEFRDSGEWDKKKLCEVGDVVASGDLDKSLFSSEHSEEYPFPVYSNSVSDEGLYGYYSAGTYPKQSITITARGTLGVAFIRAHDFMGIGRLVVVKNLVGYEARFVKECWNHMAKIPQEVTSIPQLTAIAAKKVVLLMPQIKEQKIIADFLSSVDDLISEQAKKIEVLKLHKKGLMQGLFPSIEEVGE
jgi:type I restriction enzyme S subunit